MSTLRRAAVALSLFLLPTIAQAAPEGGIYADYLVARFAIAQGDPGKAADAYLRALERNPSQPGLLRQAFLTSALSGRPEAAGLARLLPDDVFAQLWLVGAAAKAGDWNDVISRAQSLPSEEIAGILRPLLIGWADQALGKPDAAIAELRPLAAEDSLHALFALHEGLIADLAGRDEAARAAMQQARAVEGTPTLRLAQMLAAYDARHGQQAKAMNVLAQAAAATPEIELALPGMTAQIERRPVTDATDGVAEAFLAAAGSLRMQDKGQPAMLLLLIALDLRPNLAAARLLAADIDEANGRREAARRMLAQVPPTDPLAPIARLNTAALLADAGQTDAALAAFDALADSCPRSPLPLAQKAALLRAKGRYAEAIDAYDAAIDRGKPDWTLLYQRGVTRDLAHDRTGAEADMQAALKLAPDQPALLNYIGYTWAEHGERLAEARRMIEEAVRAQPNDGAIEDSLGYVMLRQGDIADAVRTLERATELVPNDPTVNGHLGDAYAAAGRPLEAGYQWRRALTLDPEPAEAERLKAKLDVPPRQSAAAVPIH